MCHKCEHFLHFFNIQRINIYQFSHKSGEEKFEGKRMIEDMFDSYTVLLPSSIKSSDSLDLDSGSIATSSPDCV